MAGADSGYPALVRPQTSRPRHAWGI